MEFPSLLSLHAIDKSRAKLDPLNVEFQFDPLRLLPCTMTQSYNYMLIDLFHLRNR